MENTFSPEDQVLVKIPQLRGNLSEVRCGKVVSATGDRVSIQFPGEFKEQNFPLDKVSLAKGTFGEGFNSDNPYDVPVQKLYRR